jgi:hypothetical protein
MTNTILRHVSEMRRLEHAAWQAARIGDLDHADALQEQSNTWAHEANMTAPRTPRDAFWPLRQAAVYVFDSESACQWHGEMRALAVTFGRRRHTTADVVRLREILRSLPDREENADAICMLRLALKGAARPVLVSRGVI